MADIGLALVEASLDAGRARLVDRVSLTIRPGRLTALVGPNGAGKSSSLKLLTGEAAPSTGAVLMEGRPMASVPARERARRRAVLPQMDSLAFPFLAEEVIAMGRAPHEGQASAAENRAIIRAAAMLADCAHLLHRVHLSLSGGERQRVQLARVLAQIWHPPADGAPRYLLLDEPTASLDLAHQQTALAAARRFADEGVGVAVVLHDLNQAASHADEIIVLAGGRIAAAGHPEEALRADLIGRVFGCPVAVHRHPVHGGPLVLALPGTASPAA